MKRIYLIRHGKAEDGFDKPDFDRDLLPKGKKKTEKIAKFLSQQRAKPNLVLVSLASRTLQTADIITRFLGLSTDTITEKHDLYLASSNSILDEIYAVDDSVNELMIIGHNPGISSLATYLSNVDIDWMSTSAVAAIDLDIEKWTDLAQTNGKLVYYKKPSQL